MSSMTRNIVVSAAIALAATSPVSADEADAKRLLKEMSDYLTAQQAISFGFDATLGVVTEGGQKLSIASSGSMVLNRPDKIVASRHGGFANVVMSFDGKTLTLLGKDLNRYAQIEVPGSIDQLLTKLQDKYNRPMPAADLLMSNSYEQLMDGVTDVQDLGSGVIDGVECNYLAFRKKEVDLQIWIAPGAAPYPCRYVITSKLISGSPEYSIQPRNWKTGDAVAATDFSFNNASKAEKIEPKDLEGANDLPGNFTLGAKK